MPAVCMWDTYTKSLPVRDETKSKYLTHVPAGSLVTYLGIAKQEIIYALDVAGKEITDSNGQKKISETNNFVKIRDAAGTQGWLWWGSVILNAKPVVLIRDANEYSEPATAAARPVTHPAFQILGVILDEAGNPLARDGFLRIAYYNDLPFWIKADAVSSDEADITLAQKFAALSLTGNNRLLPADRLVKLQELVESKQFANSPLLPRISEAYRRLAQKVRGE